MKNRTRRFHPDFATDLRVATKYYDEISSALGNRFRIAIKNQLDLISDSPEAFAIIHNQVRAVRLRYFPYLILYRSHPDHIYVVGFVHGATDREHWFERIK